MNSDKRTEIRNAIIDGASLSTADHGVLSSFVYLDYGGSGQGFGGYCLSNKPDSPGVAALWIWRVMAIAGVNEWSDLKGKPVRAKIEDGLIVAIGHHLKDKWFEPREEFEGRNNETR